MGQVSLLSIGAPLRVVHGMSHWSGWDGVCLVAEAWPWGCGDRCGAWQRPAVVVTGGPWLVIVGLAKRSTYMKARVHRTQCQLC